jgi:S1-C subfamily serine protease
LCLFTATLGSLLAVGVTRLMIDPPLAAQDSRAGAPTRGQNQTEPRAPLAPRPLVASAPERSDDGALDEFTPEERTNIAVYERANRGVVNITTRSARHDELFMLEVPTEGAGSGSVLDRRGHILTNYHVVEGASEIQVTLYDGNSYDAGVVGQDPLNDIAVLRIDAPAETLFPVSAGDSTRLRVGQKVYAVGNPFGLERTMTVGIISSLNRSLPSRSGRVMKSIIQIDAALNRGNSGGPLLNSRGELIGMNTAIASRTGENTGIGFAIPVATINRVVPQLLKDGRVIRPSIGITRVYETERGLLIATLAPDGPADRAGLKGFQIVSRKTRRGPYVYEERSIDRSQADLIVGIDGKPVTTVDELMTIVESKRPGDTVAVAVVRAGKQVETPVTLGADE